jgi:hypothetical protein
MVGHRPRFLIGSFLTQLGQQIGRNLLFRARASHDRVPETAGPNRWEVRQATAAITVSKIQRREIRSDQQGICLPRSLYNKGWRPFGQSPIMIVKGGQVQLDHRPE